MRVQKVPPGVADPAVVEAAGLAVAWQTDLHKRLSADEAARRLAHDGASELRAALMAPPWRSGWFARRWQACLCG